MDLVEFDCRIVVWVKKTRPLTICWLSFSKAVLVLLLQLFVDPLEEDLPLVALRFLVSIEKPSDHFLIVEFHFITVDCIALLFENLSDLLVDLLHLVLESNLVWINSAMPFLKDHGLLVHISQQRNQTRHQQYFHNCHCHLSCLKNGAIIRSSISKIVV